MKRYMVYLMKTLANHGVMIENPRPALLGPYDPSRPGTIKSGLQEAARAAYIAGKCAPQLIFVVLPGR